MSEASTGAIGSSWKWKSKIGSLEGIPDWLEAALGNTVHVHKMTKSEAPRLCIHTLDGEVHAVPGDYITLDAGGHVGVVTLASQRALEEEEARDAAGDETSEITQFTRAINAIAGERLYQERLWGPTEMQGRHNVTEFLIFIQDYVTEALHIQSRIASPAAENITRHSIRKIASLAIACMEQNGVSGRNMDDLEKKRQEHLA